MAMLQPFKSAGQASVALTTASVATSTAIPGDGENILIVNTCSVPVVCDFSPATLTVTANSPYVVPANQNMVITIGRVGPMFGAAFPIGTAASKVYFMRGDGAFY